MKLPLLIAVGLLGAVCAAPASQRREFLTPTEIDQVREAQEPQERLKLYVTFARIRLDAIDKEMARESRERAEAVHDLLSEYDRIIDALVDTAERAVEQRILARKAMELAVKEAPEFLKRLQALEAKNPKDIEEYRFILRQAVETTESSLEDLRGYLGKLPADPKAEKGREKEREKETKKRKDGREK